MASSASADKYIIALNSSHLPADIKAALKAEVESSEFLMATLAHFRDLDTDNNHVLDRAELKVAFEEMLADSGKDVRLAKVDMNRVLAEFDEDRSGTISFTEYLELAQYVYVVIASDQGDKVLSLLSTKRRARSARERTAKMLAKSDLDEARKAEIEAHISSPEFSKEFAEKFDRFDFDKDNRMDNTELAIALSRVGRKASVDITQHSVDMVLSEFDADGNGYLGKGEFIEMCRMLYVSKETHDGRKEGFTRFSADQASDRNFALAQKAVSVLATVMNKNEDERRAHIRSVIRMTLAGVAVVGAAAAVLAKMRR